MISPFKPFSEKRKPLFSGDLSIITKAINILRRFGTDAHVYLPGIGTLNGLSAQNYLLAYGSTGFTPVDGLVGLDLDAAGSVGSELASAASLTLTGTSGNLITMPSAVVGATYFVTYTYNLTSGSIQTGGAGTMTLGPVHTGPTSGSYSYYATGLATGGVALYSNAGVGAISNFSVKQVTGIHATSSGAARPRLERGARNLTPRSNTFTDALWFYPAGGATFVGSADPTGALNSYRSTPGTIGNAPSNLAGNNNRAYSDQLTVNGTYTIAQWVKTDAIDSAVTLYLEDRISDTVRGSGSTTTSSTWQLIVATGTTAGASAGVRILWSSTQSILLGGIGLFQGTLTAAQILSEGGIPLTTTAAASNPNAGRYSWAFSGAQSLSLGSVPFQQSDDHVVVGSFMATSKAASGRLMHIGGATDTPRIATISITSTTGLLGATWRDDAGTLVNMTGATDITNTVVVCAARKVGNTRTLWMNGVQVATNTTALGTTTATGAMIGISTAGDAPMNGSIGPVFPIKGTFSDADLITLMRQCASLTPNAPSF